MHLRLIVPHFWPPAYCNFKRQDDVAIEGASRRVANGKSQVVAASKMLWLETGKLDRQVS